MSVTHPVLTITATFSHSLSNSSGISSNAFATISWNSSSEYFNFSSSAFCSGSSPDKPGVTRFHSNSSGPRGFEEIASFHHEIPQATAIAPMSQRIINWRVYQFPHVSRRTTKVYCLPDECLFLDDRTSPVSYCIGW